VIHPLLAMNAYGIPFTMILRYAMALLQ